MENSREIAVSQIVSSLISKSTSVNYHMGKMYVSFESDEESLGQLIKRVQNEVEKAFDTV